MEGGKRASKAGQKSKGLSLLGIDASDFPPPIMQQSKTPNNIKSVIRQVNFVRAPKDQMKVQGGKVVQKVIVPKVPKQIVGTSGAQLQNANGWVAPSIPPKDNVRSKKRSIDIESSAAQ